MQQLTCELTSFLPPTLSVARWQGAIYVPDHPVGTIVQEHEPEDVLCRKSGKFIHDSSDTILKIIV